MLSVLRGTHALDQGNTKRDAYAAIRRYIRRLLGRHHRSCLRDGFRALHIEWDSELLHPTDRICPLVFAYLLWRHHFEANLSFPSRTAPSSEELAMREEATAWPVDWEVGITTWSTFVVLSFFAFAQVAKEWSEKIEGFVAPPFEEASAASLMQLVTDFRQALSPRYRKWSSRVTILRSRRFKSGEDEDVVIIGPSGNLRKMLSEHPCAGNSWVAPHVRTVSSRPRLVFPTTENVDVVTDSSSAPVPDVHIAPLERIKVPPDLDGHICLSRRLPLINIEAETDVEAIRLWLHQYEAHPTTLHSYQLAAERLLNWSVVERHKPMSSLEEADLVAFEEFLADPQPRGRWIRMRGVARSDPNWTPMVGPLSPKTRLLTLVIIRGMFDWLSDTGYCNVGRFLWRHSIRAYRPPSSLRLALSVDLLQAKPNAAQFVGHHWIRCAWKQKRTASNLELSPFLA